MTLVILGSSGRRVSGASIGDRGMNPAYPGGWRTLCKHRTSCANKSIAKSFNVRAFQPDTIGIHIMCVQYVHTYSHKLVHIHMHVHAYIHTHLYAYMYIHTYIYIHTCIHTYMHTYIHTYIHIHTHTYIYIHPCV